MRKLIRYLRSPRSDILLFLLLLLFANLVASRSYFRIDLTGSKSYSLSEGSLRLVRTLEEPLSVKVFFSDNLGAPYSSVRQYVRDILVEYKSGANDNFSYEFVDMRKPENEGLALSYGLSQVHIQELKDNEVGLRRVWMGIVLLYADRIEALDSVTSADGLEYRITTAASNMIATTSALAGLSGDVTLTLYASGALSEFKIIGFAQMEDEIRAAYEAVNKRNGNRIRFSSIDPSPEEIPGLVERYGIQSLSWDEPASGSGNGVVGLVLEYGGKASLFPVRMTRDLFGRNMIGGLENLEAQIEDSLKAVVSKSQEIGYIVGHGELDFNDGQTGSAALAALISDRYVLKEIRLSEEEIPQSLRSLIIDGPKSSFTDAELYKIDQYVMKGGNLLVFLDAFDERMQGAYQMPAYTPVSTGLERVLEGWGISPGKKYVYDLSCFSQADRQYGKMNFYAAPMLQKDGLSQKSPITKNLGYVIFFQSAPVDVSGAMGSRDARVTVLAKSSKDSWTADAGIGVDPRLISVPDDKSLMKSENLAVLVEGKFSSSFQGRPQDNPADTDLVTEEGPLSSREHVPKSVQNSKILVIGSSVLGGAPIQIFDGARLLDAEGKQPVSIFVRNAVDYLNGEEDLCYMRTKGLSLNTLTVRNPAAAAIAKYFNEVGLTILVALRALLSFLRVRARKRAIMERYNPDAAHPRKGRK